MDHFLRVVATGARQYWHLALHFVDENIDDAEAFVRRQRRVFAGRAARNEKMHTTVDLTASEPPHTGFVEIAIFRERCDERGPYTSKRSSHTNLLTCAACRALPAPPALGYAQ